MTNSLHTNVAVKDYNSRIIVNYKIIYSITLGESGRMQEVCGQLNLPLASLEVQCQFKNFKFRFLFRICFPLAI